MIYLSKIKITKRAFISKLADEKGLTVREAGDLYESFIDIILDEITKGNVVSLTGFGTFSLRFHKGHNICFATDKKKIDDYYVLKFTSSNTLNAKLRDMRKADKNAVIETDDVDDDEDKNSEPKESGQSGSFRAALDVVNA